MTVLTTEAAHGDLAPPAGWVGRARRGGVLVVAAGGDAVNFFGALAIADAGLAEWQVVAAVVALTSATVGLMHFAGVSARKRRLADARLASGSVVTLTLLWLAMGVSAFVIRLGGEPVDAALAFPGAAPVADAGLSLEHVGLAFLMLTLFLGTGGMAAWAAYNGHDPDHDRSAALRSARRRIRRRAALAAALRSLDTMCGTGARRLCVAAVSGVARAVGERRARARVRKDERRQAKARRNAERLAAAARRDAERSATLARQEQERVAAAAEQDAERRAVLAEHEAERLLLALEVREQLAHERLTTAVAAHEQVVDLVERRRADAARDAARHAAAQRTVDPWADELRDYARLRLAAALSDPATTTALTAPQLPRPSLHREDAS